MMEVLRDGIAGTGMPSWKDLIQEQDRQALTAYVRSLFKQDDEIER